MRKILLLSLVALAGTASAQSSGSHYRQGYVTKDGTYVAPSYATNPNATKLDNYSTKGNINPYTGKEGTKDPYAVPSNTRSYDYNPYETKPRQR